MHRYSQATNIVLVRHGESYNNTLYDIIKAKFGQSISDAEVDEEEAKLRDPDCTLSSRGYQQANLLGHYFASQRKKCAEDARHKKNNGLFADYNNVELFSSPMKRCLLTTKPISEMLNIPVTVIPFLYETSGCYITTEDGNKVGISGSNKQQVEGEFPNYTCAVGMEYGWYQRPSKETFAQFKERADMIVEWIWELHTRPSADKARYPNTPCSLPSTSPRDVIIVCHGNVLSYVMSTLLKGNALIVHSNSAFSHIQLYNTNITKDVSPKKQNISLSLSLGSSSSSSSSSNSCTSSSSDGGDLEDTKIPDTGTLVVCVLKCMNNTSHLLEREDLLTGNEVLDDWWIQDYVEYMPRDF